MGNKFLEKFFSPRKNRKTEIKDIIPMVEEAMKNLELPVQESRAETDDPDNSVAWIFGIENIEIILYLVKDDKGQIYFKIRSPIVKMPKDNILAFYRNLLERNLTLDEVTLGIEKDTVYIYGSRPVEGISVDEIAFLITEVVSEGETIAEELHEEFNVHYGLEE